MEQNKKSDNLFFWLFLIIGIIVQFVTYILSPSSLISLVCGILGIFSVILCSKGIILTYVFGFAQVLTYVYICYKEQLYGTIAMNGYYFLTQIYGFYLWRERLNKSKNELINTISTRKLPTILLVFIGLITFLLATLTGYLLSKFTDDSQPYLDAYTTIPSLVAQVLMIFAYREQWYLWFFVDILYAVMWARAADYCLLAQHIFWLVNCIYGFIIWTKALTPEEPSLHV